MMMKNLFLSSLLRCRCVNKCVCYNLVVYVVGFVTCTFKETQKKGGPSVWIFGKNIIKSKIAICHGKEINTESNVTFERYESKIYIYLYLYR